VEEKKKAVTSDMTEETGLKFFGAVTASISHEIKNRMAIINEQAGLLEDFVRMAEKGRELNPERLMRLADSVKNQVAMSDGIIKNMNRFAHSVDVFWQAADLGELLLLIAALAKRTADNREVRLEVRPPEASLKAGTSSFYLMNLVWLCLEALMQQPGKDKSIVLGCEKVGEGAAVWLSGDGFETELGDIPLGQAATGLVAELNGQIRLDTEKGWLRILLPLDGGQGYGPK
jgi:C4-dicarboxylate-specific signal transduction histidine kinase